MLTNVAHLDDVIVRALDDVTESRGIRGLSDDKLRVVVSQPRVRVRTMRGAAARRGIRKCDPQRPRICQTMRSQIHPRCEAGPYQHSRHGTFSHAAPA